MYDAHHCAENRKTRGKRAFHYFLLLALLVMFSSTTLFWAGVIITALDNQDGASEELAYLQEYIDCKPTSADMALSCANSRVFPGPPIGSVAPAYFTTVALVSVVSLSL